MCSKLARITSTHKLFIWLLLIQSTKSIYHTIFCMPTARRDVSYLDQVVQSYHSQNIFRMDGVTLAVLDTDNSTYGKYTQLMNRVEANCAKEEIEGKPSCKVRQQGLDVSTAMTQCANFTSGWVVLTEDDCEACTGAIDEVVTALSRLDRDGIAMAKFSKFVRATAFPSDVVPRYVDSVLRRIYDFPYDVTVIEEWAAGRRQYIHDKNLFHHIGSISTEPRRNDPVYRAKYAELRADKCFEKLE